MNIIFDPINSIVTLSVKDFDYNILSKYLQERGFFFPIISDSIVLSDGQTIKTFKAQSPLNFILSSFIKDDSEKFIEYGKRLLKSSSGYRLAGLYAYNEAQKQLEYISIKIYSNEIKKEFKEVKISLSNEEKEILSFL